MHRDDIKRKNLGGDNCVEHAGHLVPPTWRGKREGDVHAHELPCDVERNGEAAAGFCLHDCAVGLCACLRCRLRRGYDICTSSGVGREIGS